MSANEDAEMVLIGRLIRGVRGVRGYQVRIDNDLVAYRESEVEGPASLQIFVRRLGVSEVHDG